MTLSEDDRRVLAVWAADCAERTLPLFEAMAPGDGRPRAAIDGLRAFAGGGLRIGPARALSVAAHAAARDVGDPVAAAAARATGHAVATAHMASHARGVPAYGAIAVATAAPDDPAAVANHLRWCLDRATPEVRDGLRRLPPPTFAKGILGSVIRDLHAAVGGQETPVRTDV